MFAIYGQIIKYQQEALVESLMSCLRDVIRQMGLLQRLLLCQALD